jgi:thiol:disulfide interchange protein DsbD
MSLGQGLTQGGGLKQSYFTGVLAAVVASPCTAPFMAPALGFAITQPTFVALMIFAGLGLGMALPLLLLSYLPHLNRWMPKPGAWMETFKQALAFPLYLTAIWLLWVLSRQLGADVAMLIILGGLAIVFIFWLGQRASSIGRITGLLTIALIVFMSWNSHQQPTAEKIQTASEWEPYNEERLRSLRQQGKAVFINMTADWCITCLANEKIVFTETTIEAMKRKDITLIKGDWTNYDPRITLLLEKYGRGGVPLYLLFPANANADAKVLPQILSPSKFKRAIEAI